jgi:hypothetical protein
MTDTSPESAATPRPASLQRIQAVPRRPRGVPPRRPRVVHAHGGARLPGPAHGALAGGMPGWQITLIAAAAVLADRMRATRRRAAATTAH